MSTKHTPGEWKTSQDGKYIYASIRGGIEKICDLPTFDLDGNPINQPDANAQLIEAAPKLLEGIKAVIALIDSGDLIRDCSKDGDFKHFKEQGIRIVFSLNKATDALQKATFKAICALLVFSLLFASCSQSFKPVTQKNHNYKGFTGKYRCSAACARKI